MEREVPGPASSPWSRAGSTVLTLQMSCTLQELQVRGRAVPSSRRGWFRLRLQVRLRSRSITWRTLCAGMWQKFFQEQVLGPQSPDRPIAQLNPDGEMGTAVWKTEAMGFGGGGRDTGLYAAAHQEAALTHKALGKAPQLRPGWAPPRPSEVAGGDPPGSYLSERGPLSPETRPVPKQPGSRLIHPTCEHKWANPGGECKPAHQPHQEKLQSE